MSAKPSVFTSSMTLTSLNPDAVPRCNTHRKRLKFFCSKHELLLCSVCAVKRHRSCEEVLTINEASEDKKVEGSKLLDAHAQRIAIIENAIVERKAAKKLLDTNVQEIQNEIHEVTGKLIDIVKHEERTLMENVQAMQSREAETLDKDIGDLEQTCAGVRKIHDTLSQSLKFSEVDLIYAVIKEKQQVEGGNEVETIVKKSFREVDFKFIVSPHITSFLRHFKNLGQVMLSDESGGSSRVPRSNMSTPVNELPSFSSENRPRNESRCSTPQQPTTDEIVMSAREKWQQDRQRQMRAQIRDRDNSNSDTVFNFDNIGQLVSPRERRNLPMRALPRPVTPEVYNRPHDQPPRREFVARPMSTPPAETPAFNQNPKSKDVDRFNRQVHRNFGPHTYSGNLRNMTSPRSLPVPFTHENQNGQENIHHIEPVHVFQDHKTSESCTSPNERASSPWSTTSPTNQTSPQMYSVVTVKENDYGRSFAVQINDGGNGRQDSQTSNGYRNRPLSDQSYHSQRSPPNNFTERNVTPEQRRYGYAEAQRLDETGGFTPLLQNNPRATDEEKGRRWVHQVSFTSSGIGSKRLISGIGLLGDGRVLLVDQEHYTVQLYDKNHRFITEMKLESRPFDVIVLSEKKVVVSLQSERLLKFILITSTGLTTVADLNVPCDMVCYGICRGAGNYCVCCGDEVWIMSEEGRVINRLKKDKAGNGLFVQAEYVTMGPTGDVIFVSDAGNNKVLAIHVDGRRLWEFTYVGFKPSGVKCYDQYLYVCDRDQHRILMLNMEGQVVKQSVVGKLENPRALCFNYTGNHLLVTQMRYDAIVSPSRPVHVYALK